MQPNPSKNASVSNVYTLEQIITIPLHAVVAANAAAAETAINIIRKYGFVKADSSGDSGADDSWGELRYVSFAYTFREHGVAKTMMMKIPLLSLIPIPLLQVKSANFKFGVKVMETTDDTAAAADTAGGNQPQRDKSDPTKPSIGKVKAMLVTPRHEQNPRQTSLTANIDVEVEMVQSDLPAGILNLINIQQQAAHGSSTDAHKLTLNTKKISFSPASQEAEIVVFVKHTGSNRPVDEDKIVKFDITRNADFSAMPDIFAGPPTVVVGSVIGNPTASSIKVLSDDNGKIVLKLKATKPSGNQNGMIRLSSENTTDAVVYYAYQIS